MRDSSHVITGSKRKRVESSNENAHTHGMATRGSGRKRLRTAVSTTYFRDDSQSEASDMEVDTASVQSSESEGSDASGNENYDSSDDFLINSAPSKTLNRLLKHRLVELYELSGLAGDAESLTKSDIIDAIVNHRDDHASVPPSSPPGKADGASTDYSSDDGHVAGDEETDAGLSHPHLNVNTLRRRVTVHDLGKANGSSKPLRSKPKALVQLENGHTDGIVTRRRTSSRSSPTTCATTASVKVCPPATRLRSRNVSTAIPTPSPPTSKSKGKGKAKQVEFSKDVEVHLQIPSKKTSKGKEKELVTFLDSESDLTELDEDTEPPESLAQPSPRRLRSKDRELEKSKVKSKEDSDATPVAQSKQWKVGKVVNIDQCEKLSEGSAGRKLRVTPMRKAKGKIGSLKESDLEEDVQEDELEEEEGQEAESVEDQDALEEVEVDELVSSASVTPPQSHGRRTPVRRRLRPRRNRRKSVPTVDEENEGDDEEEEENAQEGAAEDDEEEEEPAAEEGDDDATIAVEPRKLRNGKIVGEEDVEMDVDEESVVDEEDEDGGKEGEVEEVEEADVDNVADKLEDGDGESVEMDAEGEPEEEEATEEEDVDLSVATTKTLIRMRRDALIRLCEARDLEPSGTKPQLAEALLQWRDQQGNEFSSPSSAGTVRASSKGSTRRKRRTKHHSSSTNTTVPVLLRSEHAHADEPRTPVPGKEKEKDSEELELDLESLGLDDREIPTEKLIKLEKIGSGGFKDVYIGKLKNRKIAISEFRGQLSAMDIKELKLLGAFNHPNIVRFLGVCIPENTKETPVMIISELCSNGDLFDYIRNTNAPSLHKVLLMMLDIARGLEYLHTGKPSIIHRDCKSSNILITAKGTAKIADFGLAKVKQSTRSMVRSLVGTVNWQAPELWTAHPKYNHKVDVFSCAMVYWEMLQWHQPTKKFPWEGMNEHAIYEIVGTKRQRPAVNGLRKQWCPEIVDLMERMWAQEHQDRPTMTEVVKTLEELVTKY
ncbi:hypothetical protein CPB84DRAFT_1761181 [Gymnopilus junonius]|uniref:Protein kinase domain-containing protein n=1 Tax=Gymnopilus junonius TaxID=109634 RepID=A0A9P5NZR3_GYMJU|nr:hypothetical protein CPB84DRAFT_1761181 [Gymnopilus junonius]